MSDHAWLLKRQTWSFSAAIGGIVMTIVALVLLKPVWALGWGFLTITAMAATRVWTRKDPMPMPYALRWILLAPRPFQSPGRLKNLLCLQGNEHLLELGPGTGKHALPIAAALNYGGVLDVLDIQKEMLDHLMRRASQAEIGNIVATPGDAGKLPYSNATFDGAYLIGVLGEIPDPDTALQELRRVLKPEGCLVIGEMVFDPDFIPLTELHQRMVSAGFRLERKTGSPWGYLARFERTRTLGQEQDPAA